MSPTKIIASIFMAIIGSLTIVGDAVYAHHPAEPCSTEPTNIANGALPECTETPQFGQQDESFVVDNKSSVGVTGVLMAAGVGTVIFTVCILFFLKFSTKIKT